MGPAGCGEGRFLGVTTEGGRGAPAESSLPRLIWTLGPSDGVEQRFYLGLQGSTFTWWRPRSGPTGRDRLGGKLLAEDWGAQDIGPGVQGPPPDRARQGVGCGPGGSGSTGGQSWAEGLEQEDSEGGSGQGEWPGTE